MKSQNPDRGANAAPPITLQELQTMLGELPCRIVGQNSIAGVVWRVYKYINTQVYGSVYSEHIDSVRSFTSLVDVGNYLRKLMAEEKCHETQSID